jgi:hypothetical protein
MINQSYTILNVADFQCIVGFTCGNAFLILVTFNFSITSELTEQGEEVDNRPPAGMYNFHSGNSVDMESVMARQQANIDMTPGFLRWGDLADPFPLGLCINYIKDRSIPFHVSASALEIHTYRRKAYDMKYGYLTQVGSWVMEYFRFRETGQHQYSGLQGRSQATTTQLRLTPKIS